MCKKIEAILERYGPGRQSLLEILQDIQEAEGYISEDAIIAVSEHVDVPLMEVYRAASFYKAFSLTPRGEHVVTEAEIPFYRHQDRVLLGQNRQVDPDSIGDYIAIGGYLALAKVLGEMTTEGLIEEIRASGLRGRGGGGGTRLGLNGPSAVPPRENPNTLSAMPTKATLAHTWTGAFSKAILMP